MNRQDTLTPCAIADKMAHSLIAEMSSTYPNLTIMQKCQVHRQVTGGLLTGTSDVTDAVELESTLRIRIGNVLQALSMTTDDYARLRQRLLCKCFQYVHNWSTAEDIVQETFVQIFRKKEQFRGDASMATWSHAILFRRALNRSRSRELSLEALARSVGTQSALEPSAFLNYIQSQDPEALDPEDALYANREQLTKLLALLPAVLRGRYAYKALTLLFLEQLSPQEAADELDIRVDHLYKVVSTARRDLLASRRVKAILECHA